MSIKPVLISGMLQRSEDIGMLKHQQEHKPVVEQQNLQTQLVKKTEELRHTVVNPDDTGKTDTHADAREKGKNEYFYRKKSGKKNNEEQTTDRVVKKNSSNGCFDVKV